MYFQDVREYADREAAELERLCALAQSISGRLKLVFFSEEFANAASREGCLCISRVSFVPDFDDDFDDFDDF